MGRGKATLTTPTHPNHNNNRYQEARHYVPQMAAKSAKAQIAPTGNKSAFPNVWP